MGKAKRFNSYDSIVAENRKVTQSYGQARQDLSTKAFRSMPQEPAITTKIGGSGTGDGEFLTVSLSADQTTNIAATNHVEFDTKDEDGGIELQTGAGQADGIFELLGSRKYILSAQLRPEFSGATGQLVVAWYDRTNAAEIGSRAIYESQTHASHNANQPLAEVLVTPATNIDVEVRIISVTALTALANEYCTASLFEIALGGFGAGGGGAGGSGITFPITPTIKDESDTWTSPVTIDLSAATGHVTKFTLDTNLTLVFSNPPASGTQIEFEIEFVQDATGGRTVTHPASVVETVTIASGASKTTIVTYRTNDGGTTYHAIPALRGSISLSGGGFATTALDNLAGVSINTSLISDSDNVDDLGSATKEWKDLFIDGTANIDTLSATTMAGTLTMGGNDITGVGDYLLTDANRDIGTTGTPLDGLFAKRVLIQTGGALSTGETMLRNNAGNMEFNVPLGSDFFSFFFTGANKIEFSLVSGLNKIDADRLDLNNDIQLQNAGNNPAVNGNIRMNVTDVKVFSGGAVRNLTDIGDITGKATTELDNLGTTSINANLLPQAGKVLGNSGNIWSSVFANKYELGTAGTFSTTGNEMIADATEGFEFHTPAIDAFRFFFGTDLTNPEWTINKTTIFGNDADSTIQLESTLKLNDTATDNINPSTNGQFRLVGNDVKIFSGGAVRNITNFVDTSVINTWTADQISDGLSDLGTTANPWNNIVSDNTLFCSNFKVFTGDSDLNFFNDIDLQSGATIDFADTASSAGSGAGGTLPANVENYLVIKVNGVLRRVAFYPV